LEFKGLKLQSNLDLHKHRIKIRQYFREYTKWGGFPEVVLSKTNARKQELLLRYFDDILMKDVVKRYNVNEIEKLQRLADLYLSNIATLQSFNKLKVKVGLSLDTTERFSRYLGLARLFIYLDKFDWSRGKQVRSVKKVYVSDIGFYSLKGFRFSENLGRIAENLVAIELIRRKSFDPTMEIYYWRDYQDHEVDFVVKVGKNIAHLIQVSAISSVDDIRSRELNSLAAAHRTTGCDDLLVITDDYEGEHEHKGARIRFVPLWRWCIELTK